MADDRAARIERLNRIQKLREATGGAEEIGPTGTPIRPDDSGLIEGVLKGADYDRATTGGPLTAKILDMIPGGSVIPVYNQGEVEAARNFETPYPSGAEQLQKKWSDINPVLKHVGGAVIDTAGSPSTYLSVGGTAAAKALEGAPSKFRTALELLRGANAPLERTAEAAGKPIWKQAYSKLDADAIKHGGQNVMMPSDVLTKNNVYGWSMKGINSKVGDLAAQLIERTKGPVKAATEAGVKAGPAEMEMILGPLQAKVDEYLAAGTEKGIQAAKPFQDLIEEIKTRAAAPEKRVVNQVPSVIVDQTGAPIIRDVEEITPAREGLNPSQMVTNKKLHSTDANYNITANTPHSSDAERAAASGYRAAVENSVAPEARDAMIADNQDLGALLGSKNKRIGEVAAEQARNLFSGADAVTGALGQAAGGEGGKAVLWKKLLDYTRQSGPVSILGKSLDKFGKSSVAPRFVTELAKPSPWRLMKDRQLRGQQTNE